MFWKHHTKVEMSDKERVIELIENGQENDCCDFKMCFYHKQKYGDMIKDIVAFANNTICDDKYIVFNVDDETHEVGKNKLEPLPDISVINDLIGQYVEPYINTEIGSFLYKNSNVWYIKVPNNNIDRPYLIKKIYEKNGKCLFNQGDVFIRKNATNFKANRRDLDEIYDLREKKKIVIESDEIYSKEYCIKNVPNNVFLMTFRFENYSKSNYLLNHISVKIEVDEHTFSVDGRYICGEEDVSLAKSHILEETSYSIEPNHIIKKKLGFQISDVHIAKIRKKLGDNVECNICLEMIDVKGEKICSKIKRCKVDFT